MFSLTSSHRYYLYRKPVDMRKSFDGLCGIVSNQMNCDATTGEVYIFINRLRDKIKLLHWESGGFVLYYKRLESGTFKLPRLQNDTFNHHEIDWTGLILMIEGITVKTFRQQKRFLIGANEKVKNMGSY